MRWCIVGLSARFNLLNYHFRSKQGYPEICQMIPFKRVDISEHPLTKQSSDSATWTLESLIDLQRKCLRENTSTQMAKI